jgi:hypothetical protein
MPTVSGVTIRNWAPNNSFDELPAVGWSVAGFASAARLTPLLLNRVFEPGVKPVSGLLGTLVNDRA